MTQLLDHTNTAVKKPGAPEPSRGAWATSYDVADHAVPTGREEAWRFTPIRPVQNLVRAQELATETGSVEYHVTAPEGIGVGELHREVARNVGRGVPADLAAAQAAARAKSTLHVTVPEDMMVAETIRVELRGHADGTAADVAPSWHHVIISVGDRSHARVLVTHTGVARASELITVVTGDESTLTLVTDQQWADSTVHLCQQDVTVGRDAQVKHIVTTTGGELVRVSTNVHYGGSGGQVELLGTYFARSGQHVEHRSFVDHDTPNCSSDVLYKGALRGETARSVWIGDVLIRAGATGTETFELNRNLLLSDGARADSVPNLEIETGEIAGAGHASATGRFDDDQLFYLMARGIPEAEARQLVVRGFFADIVGRIGDADVTTELMARFEECLDGSVEGRS